ncbi:hypothetical protein BDV96DRAFT_386512 [Lophiotrema nucula]|uniref:Rhodopsin domain-containing protein n=1 Tax=Lophiotrema nucula TaxID=690887 RepID=A0A6A5ZGV6_9PLEO|nr:hypothetical protein BDV96DRAFT_386512 [Lophiotrema nucula]
MAETFDYSFQRELALNSWIMYGIGMFVIVLRAYARWRRAGSVGLLAPDDWIMITAVPALYTTLIVCLNLIAGGGGSNLYPPEQFATFTPDDIQERIKGSKIVVVSEQAMLNVIWSLKVCMLFMYARMTAGTKYLKWVKYLGIYVFLGWLAVEIAFFTACRPFQGYWGMPPPNPQCTTLEHYAMVQAVFNISSDICMLAIPLPMIVSLSLPLKQKIVLSIVFSMGAFVIIAAILTKVYNLSDVYSTVYMLWYTREASVAVYVANLPGIWPLLREHIRFLRNHTSYPSRSGTNPLQNSKYGNLSSAPQRRSRAAKDVTLVELEEIERGRKSFSKSTRSRSVPDEEERVGHFGRKFDLATIRRGSPESDERRLKDPEGWGHGLNLEVHVDKTIEVQRGSWDGAGRQGRQRDEWEVATQAPKVKIEGPDGEILNRVDSR